MPHIQILGGDVPVGSAIALVDTNLLVAFFHEADAHHAAAKITIEEDRRYEWVVTGPVIVEACGLLMRRAGRDRVRRMLAWLATPGKGVLILTCSEGPNEHQQRWLEHTSVCDKRQLDFVDAYLMRVATIVRTVFGTNSPVIPIVTADSDFYRGGGAGYRYGVLDFREVGSEVVEIA